MSIQAWVIHGLLAVVFFSAAVSKSRGFRRFAEYLVIPFGDRARLVGSATISLEILLAAAGIAPALQEVWAYLAVISLTGFTLFYSVRLSMSEDTSCSCWGAAGLADGHSFPSRSLAPSLLAIRNSALVFTCLLAWDWQHSAPIISTVWLVLPAAGCMVIIGCGLFVSVLREKGDRGRRWRAYYEPRWQRTGGCWRLDENS